MPDAALPLGRHHAGAHRRLGDAGLAEQRAVARVREAEHDRAADAALRSLLGRVVAHRRGVDREAPARVEVRELGLEIEVPVADLGDAARHLPVTGRNAFQSVRWAGRLPSLVTQRG